MALIALSKQFIRKFDNLHTATKCLLKNMLSGYCAEKDFKICSSWNYVCISSNLKNIKSKTKNHFFHFRTIAIEMKTTKCNNF